MGQSKIICAIDSTDIGGAQSLIRDIAPYVGAIKVGLGFFVANGAVGVSKLNDFGLPIFLDLKFHDIPNTVAKAIYATAGINSFMMTVHSSGGQAMLRAAIDASMQVAEMTGLARPYIIGVTTLTSMDQNDLYMIGIRDNLLDHVKRLADLADSARLDGVVCSSYEIEMLRAELGDDFLLIVPGIRPIGSAASDQKRIMTPKEAINRGASYVVIGRPITEAANPKQAAFEILKSLE